jgi:hypothetical protein
MADISPYSAPPAAAASKVAVVTPLTHTAPQQSLPPVEPRISYEDFPFQDLNYTVNIQAESNDVSKLLSLIKEDRGFINNYGNSSQVLINTDRIILNTKRDYLMLFGEAGVAISSKNPVNIDSDSSVTLAASEGIFLGIPNNGDPYDLENQKKPTTKGDPTTDQAYEPIPLGLKLANLLEDLFVILKNARITTPMGLAYFREDTQYDMANLQARLPEILSSLVFVDGISHESTDPAPAPPTVITNSSGPVVSPDPGASAGGGGAASGTPIVGSGTGANANKLRTTLRSLGYSEKGSEIDNGGVDITPAIEKVGSSIFTTIKTELPNLKITVTGGNDKYHQTLSYNSRHKMGNALDFVIYPYDITTLDKVVNILRRYAAGNNPNFRFIDEYRNLTAAGTGNHFHISWGAGTESQKELNKSLELAAAGKLTNLIKV